MTVFTCMWTLFLLVTYLIVFCQPVHAYVDPGTGSLFVQILAAGLFASLFVLKSYWSKFVTKISQLLHRKREQNEEKQSTK